MPVNIDKKKKTQKENKPESQIEPVVKVSFIEVLKSSPDIQSDSIFITRN